MEINNGYDFLSNETKVTIAYAMQYAFSVKDPECWKIVLMRSDVIEEDLFDISLALASHNILLSLYTKDGLSPKLIVDAFTKSYDEDKFWELAFGLDPIKDYLEKLKREEILSLYGHVKSDLFWKIVNDLNPEEDDDDGGDLFLPFVLRELKDIEPGVL